MEEQDDIQQDDIPMMDAPDPVPNPSSSQRFSIVDVLGGAEGADVKDLGMAGATPDPMHSNMYECDEEKVLQRLQTLYPHTDIQKLPRHWNKNDRWMPAAVQNNGNVNQTPILELSSDFLRVTKRKGGTQNSKDAAAVRANRPIPRTCIVYYFEVTIVNKGTGGYMGIGLSEKTVSLNRLPGWDQTSYGYHGDDGNFFSSSGKGVEYGPTFTTDDVVGCGLNFVTREIFFTKNGKHLGVANTHPVPLVNDLYPTVGMQTAEEMVGDWDLSSGLQGTIPIQMDANFGQRPFEFDIASEVQAAEAATQNAIATIELAPEKVLWMNNLIANWMAHEGYSRALEALNRNTGGKKQESAPPVIKSDSQSSALSSNTSKEDSQQYPMMAMAAAFKDPKDSIQPAMMDALPTSLAGALSSSNTTKGSQQSATAVVADELINSAMRSSMSLFGPNLSEERDHHPTTGGLHHRRSVVRSTTEVKYEDMEQRRAVVRMVKRGQLGEAIERIEKLYPNLMESNRQLALLLKIQQFVEMISVTTKELPPLPQEQQQQLLHSTSCSSPRPAKAHSPSPRPLSSRGGKRTASSAAAGGDESQAAGGSSSVGGDDGLLHQHNPVKRRSSDEECTSSADEPRLPRRSPLQQQQHQNGNSMSASSSSSQLPARHTAEQEEFMEISEESQDGQAVAAHALIANGRSNGTNCPPSVLVGTPPTSTTIIDEPSGELELVTDGLIMDTGEEQDESQHGGFANADEQNQFSRYSSLLEFGHQISEFAHKMDIEEAQPGQGCAPLRQRMNEAFSLICYRDPSQSDHAYLLEQTQRDLVAKTLNAAILGAFNSIRGKHRKRENRISHKHEGISPLDKCLRHSRWIRDQALAYSASAVFADTNALLGEEGHGHGTAMARNRDENHNFEREKSSTSSSGEDEIGLS